MRIKSSLFLSVLTCTLFLGALAVAVPRTYAQNEFWIYGTVATTPITAAYNSINFTEFNMTVTSNSGGLNTPLLMDVLVPTALNIPVPLGTVLNLTGATGQAGLPVADFLAMQLNAAAAPDYLGQAVSYVKQFFAVIGNFTQTYIVQEITNLIQQFSPFAVPPLAITLGLMVLVGFLFVKFIGKLPWWISIILFFVVVAMISNLASTLNLI